MKIIRLNVFILSLGLLALLSGACQASGGDRPNSTSFVGKKWQMEKFTVSPSIDWDLDGSKDTDIFALLEPCDKDDFLILREDGIVIREGGAEKCDEDEDLQWEDGTWKYDGATSMLTFLKEGKQEVSKVLKSNSESLILEHHFKSTKGEEHVLTAVYRVKR
ncbi:hypothetical protein [Sphingobacterium puteale]|uniref:hypothetical protein n=1 Tax=Sphingobacterium puteale TaxID=2420510 RepID=UPI003D965591